MTRSSVPAWALSAAGSEAISAEPLRWGFHNESWLVELPGDRRVVATRYVDPTVGLRLRTLLPALGPRFAAAGLPIPVLIEAPTGSELPAGGPTQGVVVTEYLDGIAGAELLGRPGGPALIGSIAGTAWRRLSTISGAGLGLPALWASPEQLVAAVAQWVDGIGSAISQTDHSRLATRLESLAELLSGRPSAVVHGDFVPANILVHGDAFVGLVDLESVRLGDPLIDAAWFDWIVYFHHRGDAEEARRGFAVASGIEPGDPTTRGLLSLLPLVRILESLEDNPANGPGRGRARWLEHLSACLGRIEKPDS